MLIKSLTESRKLMAVLNRLGYCISYSKHEELETELATAIQNRQKSSPKGAKRGVTMGNAYDNYDELVHTLSGLDSLHDTMGIFYQNVNMDAEDIDEVPQPVLPTEQRRRSRKRKLDVTPVEIAPYRKKPRMDKFEYPTIDHQPLAELSHQALKLDTLFMVGHSMNTKTVPMCGGFNARVHQDKLPKQVVHYLPNINRPINRDDGVPHTHVPLPSNRKVSCRVWWACDADRLWRLGTGLTEGIHRVLQLQSMQATTPNAGPRL